MTKAIVLGLVVVFVVLGAAIFQILRSRTFVIPRQLGFREYVKNPDLWDEKVAADELDRIGAEDAATWDEDQIAKQVSRYVFGSETSGQLWPLRRQLERLSPRTNEPLLAILKDPSRRAELMRLRPGDWLEEAPVMRVCTLFHGNMPAEGIALLDPYLSHPSSEIRKECILAVAESGLAEALPAIEQALHDEDEYVCSYAIMGMDRANRNEKLSAEVRTGVIDDLKQLVTADQETEDAARLMAQLDPMQAKAFLLSDGNLDSEKYSLHEILRVVGEFDFDIPREKVKALIAIYAGLPMEYPHNGAMCESLALLGKFQEPADEPTLERYSTHADDRVSDGAARGLLAYHGLQDFQVRIAEQEQAGGLESLTKEQRMYQAVWWLDAEVNNGGHSQYFFNSSGDDWQLALEGLEAMGFKERREIFQGVLKLFGNQKPITDHNLRQRQLAGVYSKHEEGFDEFDSQYYDATENVEVFTTRFVIQNAEKFK